VNNSGIIDGKKGNKKALVIAVSDYESSSLKSILFCKNDGQEMYEVLKKLGYDIPDKRRLIGNVDSQILKNTIYDFFTNEENQPDDTLIFYYSGHGVPDKWGTNYLAPSNIDSDRPFLTGFSFDNLTNAMLESNSLSVVTILDSCYSGSLKIGKGLDSKGGEDGMTTIANKIVEEKSDKLHQGIGRCLLASSQGYEEAYDKEEKDHSIFTYYLLDGLNGNKDAVDDDGNVTYDTLGKFISREFGKLPPSKRPKQTPVRKGELAGADIILAEYPKLRRLKEDYYSLFGRGEKYLRDNKFQEALQCYNAILLTHPEDQDSLLRKGYLLLRSNEDRKALECFDHMIKLNNSNSQAWYYKAQLHLKTKDYETANKCLQEATDISPNDERLWEIYKKVKSLLKTSRNDRKQETIPQPDTQSLNSSGNDDIINHYDPIKDNSQSSSSNEIEKPKMEDTNDLTDLISKGNALYDQGKYKESIKYFEESLKLDPLNEEVVYNRFRANERLLKEEGKKSQDLIERQRISNDDMSKSVDGDIDKEASVNDKGTATEPYDVVTLNNKALGFYNEGNYNKAIEWYDKVLALDPRNIKALNNKALALYDQGIYKEAIEWYDRALAIDPDFKIAKENKKLALKRLYHEEKQTVFKNYSNVKITPRELSDEIVSYLQERHFRVVFIPVHQNTEYRIEASKTSKLTRIVGISKSAKITIRGLSSDLEIALSTGEFKKNLASQVAISAPLSAMTLGIPTVAALGTTYYTNKTFRDDLWQFIESKLYSISDSHTGAPNLR